MTESLVWLVKTLAEISSINPSASHTTKFINACSTDKPEDNVPKAFEQFCQNNHISFATSSGVKDWGVFDIAVQFNFSSNTITVAHHQGHGKLVVMQRALDNGKVDAQTISIDKMDEAFTPEPIYLLNLNEANQLPITDAGPLKGLWDILMQDKKDVILIYIFAIFGGAINLTLPLGIQAIINLITMQQINTSWWVLLLMVLLGVIFTGATQIFQLSIIETLQQRLFLRAVFTFSSKIPKINLEKLKGYYPPELINRFFDVLTIQKGMSKILMDFSTSTLQILFGLLLLSFYHPFFIFFGLLWLIILVIILIATSKAGLRTSIDESTYKYKLVYWLQEVGRNLVTFKLSDSQQYVFQRTDGNVTSYLKSRKAHFRVLLSQFVFILLFRFVVTGTLLIVGSILVVNQELNIGQFVAAEIIIILLMVAAEKLMRTMETVFDVLTSIEKLKKVTSLEEDVHTVNGYEVEQTGKGINVSLKDVTFSYHPSQKPVFINLSLDIKAGEKVVIKATGAPGKTTILKLLAGLNHPTSGKVLLNDLPRDNYQHGELLNVIGHNLDTEEIFNGSIEDNISLGRNGIGRNEVLNVCRICDLMPFIQDQPQGLLTELSASDRRLSKNVTKRITLARALANQAELLIIDDELPNLSSDKTLALWEYLTSNNSARTIIMVTDNNTIIQLADRVYELKNNGLEMVKS